MRKPARLQLFATALLLPLLVFAQITTPPSLRLLPAEHESYHLLETSINSRDLVDFRTSRGLKLKTIPKKMSFDEQPLTPETMKLRGKRALGFDGKVTNLS